jgi:hypothetical protein
LGARGYFTAVQQKELVRNLIRRVIVTRPVPDPVEATIVWVNGALTALEVHSPRQRQTDIEQYPHFVEHVFTLGAAGYHECEMVQRLAAEGFRSARSPWIPVALIGEIHQACGQISLTEQLRAQAKLEGQWTAFGVA